MGLKHFFRILLDSRYDVAFIKESPAEIVEGKPILIIPVHNPFAGEYWFADPFILDVTDEYIYVLVEAMPIKGSKGVIAKLSIKRESMTIEKMDIVLDEAWHLSFPDIIRKGGHVYIMPESASSGQLYLYELFDNHSKTKRVKTILKDIVWDTTFTKLLGEPLLLTSHQDDFHLNIYSWDEQEQVFVQGETIASDRQNMRMAGSLFKVGEKVYCPSQISTPYCYGVGVELKEIENTNGKIKLTTIRKIFPPKSMLTRGLHTLNTYNGVVVVDILRYNHFIGLIVGKLVEIKKRLRNIFKKHR